MAEQERIPEVFLNAFSSPEPSSFVPAGVPSEIVWRVEQAGFLFKPPHLIRTPERAVPSVLVIQETDRALKTLFETGLVSHEVKTDMKRYLSEHARSFTRRAIQGFFNRERPPIAMVDTDELDELFDSANPFKKYSEDAANEAYEISRTVLSLLPVTSGFARPRSGLQIFQWLRTIRNTITDTVGGEIGREDSVRQNLELQQALVFFDTGSRELPYRI